MPLSSEKTMASAKLVTERSLVGGAVPVTERSLVSGVEVTDDVHNARGGFGYAQPPLFEQTPKQIRGDVTFQGDGTLRDDKVGKCHAKYVRVKPEHDM